MLQDMFMLYHPFDMPGVSPTYTCLLLPIRIETYLWRYSQPGPALLGRLARTEPLFFDVLLLPSAVLFSRPLACAAMGQVSTHSIDNSIVGRALLSPRG